MKYVIEFPADYETSVDEVVTLEQEILRWLDSHKPEDRVLILPPGAVFKELDVTRQGASASAAFGPGLLDPSILWPIDSRRLSAEDEAPCTPAN